MFYDDEIKEYYGKKIIKVEHDFKNLDLHFENEIVRFMAVGDCCSESFINDIDADYIFNDAIFLEMEEEDSAKCNDYDESKGCQDYSTNCYSHYIFYKFKTSKGLATLSMRNENNGYYTGYLQYDETIKKGDL